VDILRYFEFTKYQLFVTGIWVGILVFRIQSYKFHIQNNTEGFVIY